MQIQMTFHQMDSTEPLKEQIESKAQKLQKFFPETADVKWTCDHKDKTFTSHVIVSSGKLSLNAQSSSDDLYKTFDGVLSKLEKQLLKRKEQDKDHIHHKH